MQSVGVSLWVASPAILAVPLLLLMDIVTQAVRR
jgi:hypothetical protein